MKKRTLTAAMALPLFAPAPVLCAEPVTQQQTPHAIIAAAPANDWAPVAAEDMLVMRLAPGKEGKDRTIIIQLMPAPFNQGWGANIRTLARTQWYDGISITRVQDNYVVQWGDPHYDNPEGQGKAKPLPEGLKVMTDDDYTVDEQSFISQLAEPGGELASHIHRLGGAYSDGEIFLDGWPYAFHHRSNTVWPVHCYAMVGVGRGYPPDTGSGAELYTVIGHAPRHLDRNIALVGRIVEGIEHLSSLPRGSGALGFYTKDERDKRTPIVSIRVASDLPEAEQPHFEYLSTDSTSFRAYADARANRRDPFFITPAGGADICNIPIPVRRTAERDYPLRSVRGEKP